MGKSSSIDIDISKKLSFEFFYRTLKDNDWKYFDHGKINYIKLGDIEFNWTILDASAESVFLNEIKSKLLHNENIGLVITYRNSNIGGQLIYFPESLHISINLNINRQTLQDGQTDFNWYLDRIKPLFYDFVIKLIKVSEHD